MSFVSRIFASDRALGHSRLCHPCVIERLENRRLLTNVIQVRITSGVSGITAQDVQNLPINFRVQDVVGTLTLTGDNLASQTSGNRINIAGSVREVTDLSLSTTTANSSLAVQAKAAAVPLLRFDSLGPMRSIDIRPLLANGPINLVAAPVMKFGDGMLSAINVSQGVPFVNFTGGSFSNSQINFTTTAPAGVAPALTMKLNRLTDTHLSVDPFIRTLSLNSAKESTAGAGGISATSAGNVNVASDYKYDLGFKPALGSHYTLNAFRVGGTASGTWNIPGSTNSLSAHTFDSGFTGSFGNLGKFTVGTDLGGSLTAGSISTASVGHNLLGGTLTLTNPYAANSLNLGSLRVGNAIQNSTIRSNGNVGRVMTMFTYYSRIEAGIKSGYVFGQPLTPSDYDSLSYIKSFVSDCPSHHNIHYVGSYVGASNLQNVQLGNVQTQYGGAPFGLAGIRMDKTSVLVNSKTIQLGTLNSKADLDAGLQKYGLTEASLGDFKILFPK